MSAVVCYVRIVGSTFVFFYVFIYFASKLHPKANFNKYLVVVLLELCWVNDTVLDTKRAKEVLNNIPRWLCNVCVFVCCEGLRPN